MVEPQQLVLGACLDVIVELCHLGTVLADGIGASAGAVEAYSLSVGLVVVDGAPLQRIVSLEAVRLGSVVVVELEDMVQSQGHHIVDAGLVALLHDGGNAGRKLRVGSEGLVYPLLGNGFGS